MQDPSSTFTLGDRAGSTTTGALIALTVTMFLASLGTSIANVGLPEFTRVFDSSTVSAQWIVVAYLFAVTPLVVVAGRLGDRFGRRRTMLIGIAVFSVASLICGVIGELPALIAARVVQGAGAAMMITLPMAMIGTFVKAAHAGRAMGLLGTMSAAGTAIGPAIGGLLIDWAGWPSLFLALVPAGLMALVLAFRFLPVDSRLDNTSRRESTSFDIGGAILPTTSLLAFLLALSAPDGFGWTHAAWLASALVIGMMFVRAQTRTRAPLVPIGLFRETPLRSGLAMSLITNGVAMSTLVVGPFYLSRALSLDLPTAGLVMSAGPIVAAFTGVLAGRAVDRFGAPRVIVIGLILMLIGALFLSRLSIGQGVPGYLIPLVTLTAGFATFMAANNTIVMGAAPIDLRGVVSGLLNLSRHLGLLTGASMAASVFSATLYADGIAAATPEAVVSGARWVFGIATFVLTLTLLLAWRALRRMTPTNSDS